MLHLDPMVDMASQSVLPLITQIIVNVCSLQTLTEGHIHCNCLTLVVLLVHSMDGAGFDPPGKRHCMPKLGDMITLIPNSARTESTTI